MCLCCALLPLCSRITDKLRPFSHSTASLSGYVFDRESNRPINAALVRLEGRNDSVITGEDGMFRIQNVLTGHGILTISRPGYDTFDTTVNITLSPSAETFLLTPAKRHPLLDSILTPIDGFISNEPGYVQIYIVDPDTVFSQVKIDWGDSSDPISSKLTPNVCWHRYVVKTDSTMVVKVSFYDTTGCFKDIVLNIPVSVVTPPLLHGTIIYEPSQYLAPYDTAVIIGVRILQIEENWASEIVWIINERDLFRIKYNEQTGAIGPIGNVFAHSFSTGTLKATNEVQIIVSDKYGNKSSVFGTFYIAGKSE